MQEISKVGKLSKMYTNHSVGSTSITALDDSGHKSELSIKTYSCRLSDAKKREMSKNLNSALGAKAPTTNITEHEVPILSANKIEEIFGENMIHASWLTLCQ